MTYLANFITYYAMPLAQPMSHSGALRQFLRFMRVSQIPFEPMLDEALRDIVDQAADSDFIPSQGFPDMLEICSIFTKRFDLGVAFAGWASQHGYGPFSLLWDYCSNLDDLLRICRDYLYHENEALHVGWFERDDELVITQHLDMTCRFGNTQFMEASLAIQLRAIRQIFPPGWNPRAMEFRHSEPPDVRYHRRALGCPLFYNSDFNAIIVSSADLKYVRPDANPQLLSYIERRLSENSSYFRASFPQQVRQYVMENLANGKISVNLVSSRFHMSRRTFHRRLEIEDTSFHSIVTECRVLVAREYFANNRNPNLSDLARCTGLGEASAASRFLRQHLQTGLREFRQSGANPLHDGREA